MSSKSNVHVVPQGHNRWATKHSNVAQPISTHYKKSTAVESGHKLAQKEKVELFIHRKDGTIQNRNSFGPDYCPPKDKRN